MVDGTADLRTVDSCAIVTGPLPVPTLYHRDLGLSGIREFVARAGKPWTMRYEVVNVATATKAQPER